MNEYMNQALQLAREAANEGEVPVGAVVVKDGVNKEKMPYATQK